MTYRVVGWSTGGVGTLAIRQPATASGDGMVATTMRLVNAIPYVCDAPAGLTTSLDLPLTTPRHAFA